jgi:hypothetical protein
MPLGLFHNRYLQLCCKYLLCKYLKIFYFSKVNCYKHTLIKKLSALLLIGVMLFINAIKVFHSHKNDLNDSTFNSKAPCLQVKSNIYSSHYSKDSRCPICDFDLMKDADAVHLTITLFIPLCGAPLYNCALPNFLHNFSISTTGRAPPVQV